MRLTRTTCLAAALCAMTASAQDGGGFEGLEPLAAIVSRSEGLVGGPFAALERAMREP